MRPPPLIFHQNCIVFYIGYSLNQPGDTTKALRKEGRISVNSFQIEFN